MTLLRHKTANGILWTAAQSWGTRLFSFFVILALARLVKPEAFGLVAYASVVISLAEIFIDQGFNDAIVQCPQVERGHLDTAFWISVFTGFLLTGMTMALSGVIAQLFHEPGLTSVLRWLSLSFIFSAFSGVQQAILRRNLAFKSLALRTFIVTISSGVIAVVLAILGYGVWSLVARLIAASMISAIALWKVSDWRPGFQVSRKHFRELFSYGISIVGSNFVNFFSLRGADFLIGYFLGATILGYYSLAINLLVVMTDFLISVPNTVLFPAFSRMQGDFVRIKQAFLEVSQLQSIIAFPIFAGISVIASDIVMLLYGQNWSASIPVLQVLMIIGISRSATYFYSSIIKASGKPAWRLGIWTITAILNVLGFLFVVKRGIVAVAITYVLIDFLMIPIYLLVIHRLINVSIRIHLWQFFPALASTLTMVIFVITMRHFIEGKIELPFNTALYLLSGALVYILMLRLVKPGAISKIISLTRLSRA